MDEQSDVKNRLLAMMEWLTPEQLAELNNAIRDALISAAQGQPAKFAINELVHVSQEEARRICQKIGLDWKTGMMSAERND